jgi:iron complex transport system substrate-binding protein
VSVLRFRLLLTVLFAVACRPAGQQRPAVVDDLGNRIVVDHAPRRIVSLSPATTELLFALGWGDRVVGRTRWCDYPAEALRVESVGDGLNPNVEAVAARKPDLVVMYSTAANAQAVAQLQGLGIPAINVRMDRLEDVAHSARLLASVIGDSARADSMATRFEHALDSLARVAHRVSPRVMWIVWDNPPMVIGAGSFLTQLMTLAGGRNVFADMAQPSPTVSIETIAARNPDLFLAISGDSSEPPYARKPEWQVVPAVRRRHFGTVQGSEFSRPSFRAPQAVAELEALFARNSP